ncbi:unnamed protein product [Withania somnifera]
MALAVAEVTWIIVLFKELGIKIKQSVDIHCDSKTAILIAANQIFHERTKHLNIDCHFVREKLTQGMIKTHHVPTKDQLADLLIKSLNKTQHMYLVSELSFLFLKTYLNRF